MTQAREERLAYQRGYHRGRMRMYDHLRKLVEIARAYRERGRDTNPLRACETCRRWTRGGDLCAWGVCKADFQYAVEPRMWAEVNAKADAAITAEIVTSEDFGCVGWLPRP